MTTVLWKSDSEKSNLGIFIKPAFKKDGVFWWLRQTVNIGMGSGDGGRKMPATSFGFWAVDLGAPLGAFWASWWGGYVHNTPLSEPDSEQIEK